MRPAIAWRAPELVAAVAATILGTAAWLAFSAFGWPGDPHPCVAAGDCYCELPRPGAIAQRANTWSLLPFIFVGLLIGYDLSVRRRTTPRSGSPFVASPLYGTLYAVSAIALGFGSIAFHASLRDWGGAADALSMVAWLGLLLCYNVRTLARLNDARFAGVYASVLAALVLPRLTLVDDVDAYFGWLILAYLASEVAVSPLGSRVRLRIQARPTTRAHSLPRRDHRLFFVALATFAVSAAIWSMSHADGLLCDPSSLIQGHAVWHVLNAVVVGILYIHLRSERDPV